MNMDSTYHNWSNIFLNSNNTRVYFKPLGKSNVCEFILQMDHLKALCVHSNLEQYVFLVTTQTQASSKTKFVVKCGMACHSFKFIGGNLSFYLSLNIEAVASLMTASCMFSKCRIPVKVNNLMMISLVAILKCWILNKAKIVRICFCKVAKSIDINKT